MKTPEQAMLNIKRILTKERWMTIMVVFALGLLAHGYRITNNIPNWDSLLNEYHDQNMINLGRCFLGLACGISSFYELPFFNGILSILYLAVTAVIVCEILEIRTGFGRFATAGILVTFPTVASTFCYIYTADGYFLSAMCMAVAVLLLARKKWGWIPAAILICFGTGVYQAYITFAMVLILLKAIGDLLFRQKKLQEIMVFLGKSLLAGGAGSVIYYAVLNGLLRIQNNILSDYQGISDMYSMNGMDLVWSLKQIVKNFFWFFFGSNGKWNFYVTLNLFMILLILFFTVRMIVDRQIYNSAKSFLLLFVLGIAVPVACFAVFLMAPNVDYHMLMCYGVSGVYLYFIQMYEQEEKRLVGIENVRKWAVLTVTVLILFNFVLIANITYHLLELSYEKSYGTVLRISDRVEQTEGWEEGMTLAVLGEETVIDDYFVNMPPMMTGTTLGLAARESFNIEAMLGDYTGLVFEEITDETEKELAASKEFQQMTSWPGSGSVKIIGDVMVIKLGEVVEK